MGLNFFNRLGYVIRRAIRFVLRPVIQDVMLLDARVFGSRDRLIIAKSALMQNTLFNTISGTISVGEYCFAGHNVSIITGTHDYCLTGEARQTAIPRSGNDIHIGHGVWIGSNALILGPCRIGDNAVVAAGALVREDVPAGAIVAGVPARIIRRIESLG